jgi:hypothetical protein
MVYGKNRFSPESPGREITIKAKQQTKAAGKNRPTGQILSAAGAPARVRFCAGVEVEGF